MPDNVGSNWISEVRWDERGRPYQVYLMDIGGHRAGERSYVAPENARNSSDPRLRQWASQNQQPGESLFQNGGTWNNEAGEFDRGVNWNNLATIGTGALTGVGMLGALTTPAVAAGSAGAGGAAGGSGAAGGAGATGAYLAPAAGGSGAATGGALASSSIPITAAMQGPNTSAMVSQGASAGIPNTAALGGVAPAAANALTSGGMSLKDLIEAAAKGAPLALSALGGLGGGGNGGNAQGMDEMNRIARITEARMRRADPLHEAAVQLAFAGLPNYGREGITLPKVPLP